MSEFKDNLKALRLKAGLTQGELAQRLGTSQSRIGMYESGQRKPNFEMLQKLAEFFSTDMNFLIGGEDEYDLSKYDNIAAIKRKKIPFCGNIACGEPIIAQESFDVLDTGKEGFDFCLRCKGDSMINANIKDGDIVFIHQQDMVENGEIAAVIIENEVTLKRVAYYPEKNMLILKPENPKYSDLVYIGSELDNIHIIGRAVAVQTKL